MNHIPFGGNFRPPSHAIALSATLGLQYHPASYSKLYIALAEGNKESRCQMTTRCKCSFRKMLSGKLFSYLWIHRLLIKTCPWLRRFVLFSNVSSRHSLYAFLKYIKCLILGSAGGGGGLIRKQLRFQSV